MRRDPLVEPVSYTHLEEQSQSGAKRYTGERLLGTDPVSGKPVIARIGRYGPMVQIGETPDNSLPEAERERLKPRFASIPVSYTHLDVYKRQV